MTVADTCRSRWGAAQLIAARRFARPFRFRALRRRRKAPTRPPIRQLQGGHLSAIHLRQFPQLSLDSLNRRPHMPMPTCRQLVLEMARESPLRSDGMNRLQLMRKPGRLITAERRFRAGLNRRLRQLPRHPLDDARIFRRTRLHVALGGLRARGTAPAGVN